MNIKTNRRVLALAISSALMAPWAVQAGDDAQVSGFIDVIGNNEEYFNIRVNGSINGNADIPVNVPRNSGAATAYPSVSFQATAGEVIKIQLGGASDTLSNLVEHMLSFEIESKHIR